MKFQTLFSLAAAGLAFANPIYNRGDDFTDCITTVVGNGVYEACQAVPEACSGLDVFALCMTKATPKITDIEVLEQRRSELLKSLNSCGKDLREGLKSAGVSENDLDKLQVSLSDIATSGVNSCSSRQ
ncbi:hypothetical protein BDV34DRAFT_220595 [Aspergillus parasiticus]|uniref:Uncharacterized protein n=1 Tax=Aspergillus parasiticus TaxID=5067 RepID=A0A5N6DZE5_ASPPA|nr:hypothetical protein BDV34DRAFT_220595 [Aspergillus parasiticus]